MSIIGTRSGVAGLKPIHGSASVYSPAFGNLTQKDNDPSQTWKILDSPAPSIGGKGFLVHEYARHVGAKEFFSHYQTAWKGFNK